MNSYEADVIVGAVVTAVVLAYPGLKRRFKRGGETSNTFDKFMKKFGGASAATISVESTKSLVDELEVLEDDIKPGQLYMLTPDEGDPFPPEKQYLVEILDVKAGWVRYRMSHAYPDERLKAKMFLSIYRRVDP